MKEENLEQVTDEWTDMVFKPVRFSLEDEEE